MESNRSKSSCFSRCYCRVTENGRSLRANNLRILEEILNSTTRLIANKNSLKDWKKEKLENLMILLKGALVYQKI